MGDLKSATVTDRELTIAPEETLRTTFAALFELPRRNILVKNESLKFIANILKPTGDLAGKDILSRYGAERNEGEQERVFDEHLSAGVFPHSKMMVRNPLLGHVP